MTEPRKLGKSYTALVHTKLRGGLAVNCQPGRSKHTAGSFSPLFALCISFIRTLTELCACALPSALENQNGIGQTLGPKFSEWHAGVGVCAGEARASPRVSQPSWYAVTKGCSTELCFSRQPSIMLMHNWFWVSVLKHTWFLRETISFVKTNHCLLEFAVGMGVFS